MTDQLQADVEPGAPSLDAHWRELVTVALLGTDRREPPEPAGPVGELVADTARSSPSERMLGQVAATVAVRRAAVVPAAPAPLLAAPDDDDRRECLPSAVARWHHITASWPVLEDEWMLALIGNGWRLARELVPAALRRHRADPVRHARVCVATGSSADWLIEHVPALGATRGAVVGPEALASLPELPISPELLDLVDADGHALGRALANGIENGDLGHAHRGVLTNLVARVDPSTLDGLIEHLEAVDPMSPGAGRASALTDLARTRRRMLDELSGVDT